MKILVVSATENEILPLKSKFELNNVSACGLKTGESKDFVVDFLIAGIGGVFTTYNLIRKISEKDYDLVINTGIAGSFNSELKIGDVVFIQTDQFADLGIEDKQNIFTLFEKGYIDKNEFPFVNGKLENPYDYKLDIKKVSAITVNTTHGCNKSIELFREKFKADIETMEGAAFFYVCLKEGIKFLQIRSVSNYVEERNTANWNISLAIENLNKELSDIIDQLEKENLNWESF